MVADLRGHCIYSTCVAEPPLGGMYHFEKQRLNVPTQVMSSTPLTQLKGKMFAILKRIFLPLPQNMCSCSGATSSYYFDLLPPICSCISSQNAHIASRK